jgi:class 3 adenylate cyclase
LIKKSIFILLASLICFCSCKPSHQKQPPKAVKGVIDLRNWDFAKDGIVSLEGEWDFFFKEFLTSRQFDSIPPPNYIAVPNVWRKMLWKGKKMPDLGYASYRLKIILPKNAKGLALESFRALTASSLFINDSLACISGTVSKTKVGSIPHPINQLVVIDKPTDTLILVYHVSNFEYWKGGLFAAPRLCTRDEIQQEMNVGIVYDLTLAGGLLLFAFTMVVFYYFRQKDKLLIYFAILGIIGFARVVSTGMVTITMLFPDMDWQIIIKMELMSLELFNLCYALVFVTLFPKEMIRSSLILNYTVIPLFALVTLFTPASIHSYLVFPTQIIILINLALCTYTLVLSIIRKKEGSLIFGIALLFTLIISYNVILKLNLPFGYLLKDISGVFVLLLAFIILLGNRFAKSFQRIENFAGELEQTVVERTRELSIEKEKSEKLLLNVLPDSIAQRLKGGETTIADHYEEASVVFVDIVDFTRTSSKCSPRDIVFMLNDIFTRFDKISLKYGLEKIKTIGDCYMAASGIPNFRPDHAEAALQWALEINESMKEYEYHPKDPESAIEPIKIKFRTGLNCGPIVAGVIGEQKFIYDLWGDMVNSASRMESNSIAGKIHCTDAFMNKINGNTGDLQVTFIDRGEMEIKGKGKMRTWFIEPNPV